MIIISRKFLKVACPTIQSYHTMVFVEALNKYIPICARTDREVAAFLAQTGHESADFRFLRELWGPTAAQQRYEGRKDLGNTQPGDGLKFRGRGLIQITGRANYARMAELMGLPSLLDTPDKLVEPEKAVWSAALWWEDHDCSKVLDRVGFVALTKRINGGLNGMKDRWARYDRLCEYLHLSLDKRVGY